MKKDLVEKMTKLEELKDRDTEKVNLERSTQVIYKSSITVNLLKI